MDQRPLFSIIHPTARPQKFMEAYRKWLGSCQNPNRVEYVVGFDDRWGFDQAAADIFCALRPGLNKVTWNTGRKCIVDNANTACKVSTGGFLTIIADDVYPNYRNWDAAIAQVATDAGKWFADDLVIEVTVEPGRQDLMLLPFFSRARYERVGYGMYPEYEGMFADDDFSEHAREDARRRITTILNARHVKFFHDHPIHKEEKTELDPVYQHQNRSESYALGQGILTRRRTERFTEVYPYEPRQQSTKTYSIACCLPGEIFSHDYLVAWTNLFGHMMCVRKWHVMPAFCHTSNVYVTRQTLAESVLQCGTRPDFVLWIDDDNIVTPPQLDLLVKDLEGNPGIDMVCGWCWVYNQEAEPGRQWFASCGHTPKDVYRDGKILQRKEAMMYRTLSLEEISKTDGLIEIQGTGFPVVLMRTEVLEKIGPRPFRPIVDDELMFGFSSEDAAFSRRAVENGIKMFCDTRVKVPHLKTRALEPSFIEVKSALEGPNVTEIPKAMSSAAD